MPPVSVFHWSYARLPRKSTLASARSRSLADTGTGPGAGTPCTLQTRFRLCSVSKLTATTVGGRPAGLVARGRRDQLHDDAGEPRLTTTGYGYGMFTGHFGGHSAYYHPGDNPGYLSFSGWIPDRAASIVILANDESVSVPGLLRQLLPAVLQP
jgi:hypothetical protein